MGSPTHIQSQMSSYTNLLRLFLYCGLGGVILGTTISGISTRDKRCCPYKTVASGTLEYEGTYRLIPDDQIYVDDLPEECSYSCVYMKDGNSEDQFCFHATDPSTSDTFSQCEAAPTGLPSTSPLFTTPSPSQSPRPVTTTTRGQSPVVMSTTTPGLSPLVMSTTTPGQSPLVMSTTTPGQSPVTMSSVTSVEPSVTMTSATTGQSPVSMTTMPTRITSVITMGPTTPPAFSLFTPIFTREEESTTTRRPTMSVSGSWQPTFPTGEEEVQLRPRIRRSTTLKMTKGK